MAFLRDLEDGFVLVMSLLILPVFLAFGLILIDIGRGNNAQSDLQAAADALALAGAAELDGEPGAIADAHAAMEQISNSVSMLLRDASQSPITLDYDESSNTDAFYVAFLSDIPADDTTPIDAAWRTAYSTTEDAEAAYVYVAARSSDLQPVFQRILNLTGDIPIRAVAVATYSRAACQVVPIMICNPFEEEGTEYEVLLDAFNEGRMHGRMIRLIKQMGGGAADPVAPGNWGYLETFGTGADVLRAALAGYNPQCYSGNTVDTKPGATTSVSQGFNTRYDIYSGSYNNTEDEFPPDENISNFSSNTSLDGAWENEVMVTPVDGVAGSFIGEDSNWNLRGECQDVDGNILFRGTNGNPDENITETVTGGTCRVDTDTGTGIETETGTWMPGYWEVKHGDPWDSYLDTSGLSNATIRRQYPDELGVLNSNTLPSRFDIYEHEIDEGLVVDTPENGVGTTGRRELFTAIVNCAANPWTGAGDDIPVLTYATVFTLSPMEGSQDALDFELTDLVGFTGSTALNEKFREDSFLVR
ncbi:pilus assembly protein TadG-related protein [Marimonas lutisalis]|uniref:pilus assembly protein TadG-related protein n=1 Tax=Marimonas lutisalis TaxID=2545756 RepID=UPI0010F55C19|nr:pilus assembly protein TadG-related protein [Marimonas lutisalis]